MPAPLTFGVAGLGYWGPNLVRVLSALPQMEVAWLCDVDPDRLARYARRHPGARATQDLDEVLADESLDAVVLATPAFSHHQLALRSLQAGKHTFVEKPLAHSVEAASELIATAGARGLALMCGHTFVYSPAVQAVKSYLDRGALGELFFVSSSRVNLGLHQRDVGVLWDLGPHDFSILHWWLGEMPVAVRAIGRDSIVDGIPDVAFVTLEFPSGVIANIELSWLSPSKLRRTVVVGREKMLVYEDGAPEPLRLFDHGVVYEDPETFGEYHLSYRTGDIVSPPVDSSEPLELELLDFAHAIRTGASPRASAALARDVVEIVAAAERSLAAGGAAVTLERRALA